MKRPRELEDESSDKPAQTEVAANVLTAFPTSHPTPPRNGLSPPVASGDEDNTITTSQEPASKIIELDLSSEENDTNHSIKTMEIKCSLPPHKEPLVFSTYDEYEAHYRNTHTNRCLRCRKNFPTTHLLEIHIEDTHDSFAALKRERGEQTYSCFVEGCDRKCMTPQKRNRHLIDKHMFPKNYFFAVTRDGIDGRHSLLRDEPRRKGKKSTRTTTSSTGEAGVGFGGSQLATAVVEDPKMAAPVASMNHEDQMDIDHKTVEKAEVKSQNPKQQADVEMVQTPDQHVDMEMDPAPKQPADVEMDDLSGAMSGLQFVPRGVRFGRGGRKGFANH